MSFPQRVDLKGQLSNPYEKLDTLDLQGSRLDRRQRARLSDALQEAFSDRDSGPEQEVGRYSNPSVSGQERLVQRRLKPDDIEDLLAAYRAGDLVRDIAARFDVSRTTVIGHVTRRGLPRRRDHEWTPVELTAAADLYASGHSLAEIGERFGVNKSTVANRFRRSGLPVRRRRGWD